MVDVWRYSEANDGKTYEGWYVAFLDSAGCLAILSDYGDYAYRWNAIGLWIGLREFICSCSPEYVLSKLARKNELSANKTIESVRDAICRRRRERRLTADEARDEWDESECIGESGFDVWMERTTLQDAFEYYVSDYPSQAKAFMERVWPRLIVKIKASLEAQTGEKIK